MSTSRSTPWRARARFAALLTACATGACALSPPPRAAAPRATVAKPTPARSTSEDSRIDRLVAFAKLFGVIRHFHPSDEATSADWEALAIAGARRVEQARSSEDLVASLAEIVHPVAPTARVYRQGQAPPPLPSAIAPPAQRDAVTFVGWLHKGVQLDSPQAVYSSIRVTNRSTPHTAPGRLALTLPLASVRGKRLTVRASARVEVSDPKSSASVMIFTRTAHGEQTLASTPVKGATWSAAEVVADVPDFDRGGIYLTLQLVGDGKGWIDDVSAWVDGKALPLENADFERSKVGKVPAGWDGDDDSEDEYRASASPNTPHKGKLSGELASISQPLQPLSEPDKTVHLDLPAGIAADIPVTLYVDSEGHTVPVGEARGDRPKPIEQRQFAYSADDTAVRVADVVLAWNIFEHFYPYFDDVRVDWNAELRVALQRALDDTDAATFHVTLKRLVAALHDGHGGVRRLVPGLGGREAQFPHWSLPLAWRLVDGRLVVTMSKDAAIRAGDVVTAIDGEPAERAVAARSETLSAATPQFLASSVAQSLLFGVPGEPVELALEHDGTPFHAPVVRSENDPIDRPRTHPDKIAELDRGVMYVDLDRINDEDFEAALPRLANAPGVVFDLRGYPGHVSPLPLRHLSDQPLRSAHWRVPWKLRPGPARFQESGRWTLDPRSPRLPEKIAFLIDGRAISYAESYMGIVEAYRLAEIVGEPTAGTNGNVNWFYLPGGYRVTFTGMQVLKHDGTRHHGVGIAPTIPCVPTRKGIAEGRDEILECGVRAVTR